MRVLARRQPHVHTTFGDSTARRHPSLVANRRPFLVGGIAIPSNLQRRSQACRRFHLVSASSEVASPPSTSPAAEPALAAESGAFSWKDYWYPVVYERDVGPKDLYPFTLLGESIVVWRDSAGAVRAFRDACPHRLVPLSEGRVAPNGQLECPYHGWQFSGDGACTSIPQGGDAEGPRACATAYCCEAKQGMVWVKLQPAGGAAATTDDIPTLPELEDPDWFELAPMWRDLPMDYATLIENVVDAAHVPFTHHASVSKRQSSGEYGDMSVTEKAAWGFRGEWKSGPRKGTLGAQHTLFQGPNLMRHTIDAFDTRGFANITAVYGVPTTPGRCRLFVRQPFRFKNKIVRKLFGIMPEFMSHLGNLNVLDDDNIFLHWQEREAVKQGLNEQPIGKVYYMPGPSDAYVVAFRTWLERVAGGGPFGPQNVAWLQAAGPRLSDAQVLDHYHSHTEHCKICQTALQRITLLRAAAAVVAALGAVVAVAAATVHYAVSRLPAATAYAAALPATSALLPVIAVAAGVAAVAAAVWAWCSKTLPRFYSGTHPPPRNTVPGEYV